MQPPTWGQYFLLPDSRLEWHSLLLLLPCILDIYYDFEATTVVTPRDAMKARPTYTKQTAPTIVFISVCSYSMHHYLPVQVPTESYDRFRHFIQANIALECFFDHCSSRTRAAGYVIRCTWIPTYGRYCCTVFILMSTSSSSLWDSFTWEQVSYHLLWFDFVGSDTWSLWMFV